jgi:hypothetical protein
MSNEKRILIMLLSAAVVVLAGIGAVSFDVNSLACYQSYPFLLGGEIAGPPMVGWGMSAWAFSSPCDVPSLPLYFNAHGFGFPMSLGNFRIGLMPAIY